VLIPRGDNILLKASILKKDRGKGVRKSVGTNENNRRRPLYGFDCPCLVQLEGV